MKVQKIEFQTFVLFETNIILTKFKCHPTPIISKVEQQQCRPETPFELKQRERIVLNFSHRMPRW